MYNPSSPLMNLLISGTLTSSKTFQPQAGKGLPGTLGQLTEVAISSATPLEKQLSSLEGSRADQGSVSLTIPLDYKFTLPEQLSSSAQWVSALPMASTMVTGEITALPGLSESQRHYSVALGNSSVNQWRVTDTPGYAADFEGGAPDLRGLRFHLESDFSSKSGLSTAANLAETFQIRQAMGVNPSIAVPVDVSTAPLNREPIRDAKVLPLQLAALDAPDLGAAELEAYHARMQVGATSASTMVRGEFLNQNLETGVTSLQTRSALASSAWAGEFSQQVNFMVSKNLERAQIQIDPPELGPIQIRMHLDRDQVSLQITTAHLQVKEAIEQTLGRLQQQLESQGFSLADADVSQENQHSHQGQGGSEDDDSSVTGDGNMPVADANILTLSNNSSVNSSNIDTFA